MELAEKCEKVLKMQNEYDEKYLPPISSKTHEYFQCNDRHPSQKSIVASERIHHNTSASNVISNIPNRERVSHSKIEDDCNQDILNKNEMQPNEINGVFFAKPINITADVDQKEDTTKHLVDTKTNEEIQARYECSGLSNNSTFLQ